MKKTLYNLILVFLVGFSSMYLSACKKSTSPYYEYKNDIQNFKGTTLAYLEANPDNFSTLLAVLNRVPAIKEALTSENITFFAPVNENFVAAFKYLNQRRVAEGKTEITVDNADETELTIMLSKYIVKGVTTTSTYANLVEGDNVVTLNDYPMHITVKRLNSSGFINGGSTVIEFSDMGFPASINKELWITTVTNAVNIGTDNGTVHILTPLHNFGFDKFTTSLNK